MAPGWPIHQGGLISSSSSGEIRKVPEPTCSNMLGWQLAGIGGSSKGNCKTLDSGSTQGHRPENTGLSCWSTTLEVLLKCNRVTPEPRRCPADHLSPHEQTALIATWSTTCHPARCSKSKPRPSKYRRENRAFMAQYYCLANTSPTPRTVRMRRADLGSASMACRMRPM